MKTRALAKYIRISPYKAREVIDEIRGKDVNQALRITQFSKKKAAGHIRKTLESAIANAEENFGMDVDQLIVKEAYVNGGPTLKRLKPRAMGRADIMNRRTSHITIIVSDGEDE
jgi:large subunit ribosomal protein L22